MYLMSFSHIIVTIITEKLHALKQLSQNTRKSSKDSPQLRQHSRCVTLCFQRITDPLRNHQKPKTRTVTEAAVRRVRAFNIRVTHTGKTSIFFFLLIYSERHPAKRALPPLLLWSVDQRMVRNHIIHTHAYRLYLRFLDPPPQYRNQ